MSDDTTSISELEAARNAMTGGDWEVDYDRNDQANIYARGQPTDWIALLPHQCIRSIEEEQKLNAAGICALHAASPALIAITKAALAMSATECDSQCSDDGDDGHYTWCATSKASEAFRAALAKVRP